MDDRPDEPAEAARPLPAGDRVWQHPSEVAMARRDDSDRRRVGRLTVGVLVVGTGLLAAGLAVGRAERRAAPAATASELIGPTVVTIAVADQGRTTMATGVTVDRSGTILVRGALVDGADRLRAGCVDGTPEVARLVGHDPVTDVAVLRTDGRTCRPTPVAAASPGPGQMVVTVHTDGDRGALAWRSGTVRTAAEDRVRDDGTVDHEVFHAEADGFDDRGDGLVFDSRGHFVGVVADGPVRRTGTMRAAVPVRPAAALVRTAGDLAAGRPVPHPWVGVTAEDLPSSAAAAMGLAGGCRVTEVDGSGPAAAAGLRPDDVVVAVDDVPVDSVATLARAVHSRTVGAAMRVSVLRGGQPTELRLTVADQPLP